MLKRLRNRLSARGLRRGAGPAPAQRLIVEELEPWILMSADAAPALTALGDPLMAEQEIYELLEQSIAARVELVFIDDRVAADDAVLANLAAQTDSGTRLEVVVIDSRRDGLAQVDAALAGRENIAALHIISHGADGVLLLGDRPLDSAAIASRAAELTAWRQALGADADILLYGCDIGAGPGGLELVQTLATLTGADVAASDDATGYAAVGADWDLEVQTGAVEARVAFSSAFQQTWQGTLSIVQDATTSAATTTGSTSLTWSHTVASGSERLLIVSVAISGDDTDITSVTYGGQALTLLETASQNGGGGVKTQLWYLLAPAEGTADVVIQTGQNTAIVGGATTFFGVDQDQPFGATATAGDHGDSIYGVDVSSAAGEVVIDSVAVRARANLAADSPQVELLDLIGQGSQDVHAGSSTQPGAALVNMSWLGTGGPPGGGQWALVAVSIRPAPNVAPVLDDSRTPVLSPTTEDAGAPSGAVGTLVSSLVDLAVPSGQVDNVTDPNAGAALGIAVTGADTANGSWWYSVNNGSSWLALGGVSNTNARLLVADGSTRLYFQPNANYNGSMPNALTFRAWDRTSGANGGTADTSTNGGTSAFSTATDTASLSVTAVNDVPTTTPVTLAPLVEDGAPRLITQAEALANAADVDGDALTATGLAIVSGNGTLVDNGNGTWTYTPAANDATSVSFSYTISDGNGGSVAGSATLDLTPVNDWPTTTPVILAPLIEDSGSSLITNADLIANAADVEGDPLIATGLTIASGNGTLVDNGNGTWTYTPAANDATSVSFSYTISDGNGGSVAGSATLDLTPVNDWPTTTPVTLLPMLEDDAPRTITSAQLLANAIDVDPDTLTATGLAVASGTGTLVDNGNGTWTYTLAPNDSGSVVFSYTIADGNGGTAAGRATLDVMPVNDAPVLTSNGGGANATASVAENTSAVTLVTSTDVDGDAVQYAIVGGVDAARFRIDSATGALTFSSPPNYEVPADGDGDNIYDVIVRASDGQGGSATQTLQIVVGAVDENPVVGADVFNIADSQRLIVTTTRLLANDADPEGDTLQLVSWTNPVSGVLEHDSAGNWRYTPSPDFTGNDRFTYTVADAGGRSATAEVLIVVTSLTPESGGAASPSTSAAASPSTPTGPSGPSGGGAIGAVLGGLPDARDPVLDPPVDVGRVDESAVWETGDALAAERGAIDTAVSNFAAEIERQRVYDARLWAPPDQLEFEQIATNMNGNVIRLALSMGLDDSSRSLAVFDQTFQDVLDSVRHTDRVVSEIMVGSSVAVGAGIIAWLLRGGALAASLLSVLPAWSSFDPVPILARRSDKRGPTTAPEDSSEAAVKRVLRPRAPPQRRVRS